MFFRGWECAAVESIKNKDLKINTIILKPIRANCMNYAPLSAVNDFDVAHTESAVISPTQAPQHSVCLYVGVLKDGRGFN